METHLFSEIGIILIIATGMALIMRMLRQPLIIGHILTGLLVGPLILDIVRSTEVLRFFGEIGIAFLLFLVGINLNPRVLKDFGKVAVITGIGQVLFTTIAGVALAMALGFGFLSSLYIALALSFSSTIIILKLIADKGDMDQLYAKISVGFLLVQDFVAILLLFAIPLVAGQGSWLSILELLAKGILVAAGVLLLSFKVLPHCEKFLSRSQELLFLFANAWGIGIAAIFWKLGFSLESGALIAGIGLSVIPFRHEVAARMAPLKDFFLVLFFILLGAQMVLSDVGSAITPVTAFSLLILIGNPIILMIILGLMGYRKKTSLLTGFTVAQISEFSLVLMALGVKLGHVPEEALAIVTVVGLITIFGSTYFILYSDRIYRALSPFLGLFERKRPTEKNIEHRDHEVFLFGGGRIGFDFIELFIRSRQDFVVVDHDPEIVSMLDKDEIPSEFGDAGDVDLLEDLHLESCRLVVSTIPDLETNVLILRAVRRDSQGALMMAVSHSIQDALALYAEGIDYVIMPHFLGAKYASQLAGRYLEDVDSLRDMKEEHVRHLRVRAHKGHDHPSWSHLA